MPMITPGYVQTMARYNRWQNESLYAAANELSDEERLADRGAFFRSIHETLAHVLWGDEIWLSRFGACAAPEGGISESTSRHPVWGDLRVARAAMDDVTDQWSRSVSEQDLAGDLSWFSGAMGRDLTRPLGLLIVHMFNHQTHHRGQVHAMLTAAGARPADTDLPFMPELEGKA